MRVGNTHWFLNAELPEVTHIPFDHGQVCAFLTPIESGVENQDSAAIMALDAERVVFIVADGMGGGPSGAVASSHAVRAVVDCVSRSEAQGLSLRSGILDGFEAAQAQVQELPSGAATTLLVVEVCDAVLRTYHAGDSGACVFGRGGLLKLATDFHSPVGYAVKSGLLDEDDAMEHQDRHFVSNIIGMPDMTVEMGSPLALARFDTLVLGSDGLFDNLYPAELIDGLKSGDLLQATATLQQEVSARMQGIERDTPQKPDDLTVLCYRRSR